MQTHMANKFTKFTLQDVTDQLGLMSLQGPKSQEILVSLGLEAEDQKKVQQLAFARCEEIALRTITGQVCKPKWVIYWFIFQSPKWLFSKYSDRNLVMLF